MKKINNIADTIYLLILMWGTAIDLGFWGLQYISFGEFLLYWFGILLLPMWLFILISPFLAVFGLCYITWLLLTELKTPKSK